MLAISHEQQTGLLIALAAVLAVTIVIDAGLFIAWAVTKDAVDSGKRPPLFSPRWSVVHVWIAAQVIFLLIVVMQVGGMIAYVVARSAGSGAPLTAARIEQLFAEGLLPVGLLSLIPQNALFVAAPAWFITRRYGQTLASIGFRLKPTQHEIVGAFWRGLGLIGVAIALQVAIFAALAAILGPDKVKALMESAKSIGNSEVVEKSLQSTGMFLLLLIGGGVLAPIGEEFFFRGFLYNSAKRRWGFGAGAFISAVAFAFVHGNPFHMLVIVPVGILLAMAYERTGSLWVPIGMHITFNSLQLIGARLFGTSV